MKRACAAAGAALTVKRRGTVLSSIASSYDTGKGDEKHRSEISDSNFSAVHRLQSKHWRRVVRLLHAVRANVWERTWRLSVEV